MSRKAWSFYSAGQLVFGRGAVEQLGELARRRGWRRVLLVSDANLQSAGIVERAGSPLRAAGVEVVEFLEGQPEPAVRLAAAGAAEALRAQPDAVLGLGGGSNIDLAKLTAVLAAHGGSPHDYFGFDQVPGPVLPLVCLPTTAGTGSEVSHAAVLTDTDNQMKVSTLSHHIRPQLAVVDPALSDGCPRQVTADSGIDAPTHAVEALTATKFDRLELAPGELCAYEGSHPLGDLLAEKAIRLVGEHLRRAVADGGDQTARDGMALAATLAGLAFSNCGVALVHALEYPLGGVLHCSHGAGNGLLLPYVMRFNLPERPQEIARIGELLEPGPAAGPGAATAPGSDDVSAALRGGEAAIAAVERLRSDIGIPARIRDLGGSQDQLPAFAEKAFAIKRLRLINPRAASQQDLLDILRSAF